MPRAYIKYLGNLGLNVSIEYVRYAEAVTSGEREQS
jgi:hypothetical protein